jgi:hypothetical protein
MWRWLNQNGAAIQAIAAVAVVLMCMNTDQLNNFDEAFEREAMAQREIGASCPDHSSQFFIVSQP